jgi:hypothetical protein
MGAVRRVANMTVAAYRELALICSWCAAKAVIVVSGMHRLPLPVLGSGAGACGTERQAALLPPATKRAATPQAHYRKCATTGSRANPPAHERLAWEAALFRRVDERSWRLHMPGESPTFRRQPVVCVD